MSNITHSIHSLEDLEHLAQGIANEIRPGSLIALQGELGVGKTTFTKLLAKELGIDQTITSPTFSIMNTYPWQNDHLFIHLDLYRLTSPTDLAQLGVIDLIAEHQHLIVIEWPEIAKEVLPKETRWLEFTLVDDESRKVTQYSNSL